MNDEVYDDLYFINNSDSFIVLFKGGDFIIYMIYMIYHIYHIYMIYKIICIPLFMYISRILQAYLFNSINYTLCKDFIKAVPQTQIQREKKSTAKFYK